MLLYFQKILIIDDDAVDRFILNKTILRTKIAKEIIEAESGIDALKKIGSLAQSGELLPDVIFLDISMAQMDGFAFLETFEKFHNKDISGIPIAVICSVRSEKEKERSFKFKNVIDYLVKPLGDGELVRLTDRLRLLQAS